MATGSFMPDHDKSKVAENCRRAISSTNTQRCDQMKGNQQLNQGREP